MELIQNMQSYPTLSCKKRLSLVHHGQATTIIHHPINLPLQTLVFHHLQDAISRLKIMQAPLHILGKSLAIYVLIDMRTKVDLN